MLRSPATSLNRLLGAAALFLALAAPALAQLTPDRLYYGAARPVPMTIQVPAGSTGAVEVALLRPVTAELVEKAAAQPGAVDFARLFPNLWATGLKEVLYAQLMVGGEKVGAAVVLQPMFTPLIAVDQAVRQAVIDAFRAGERLRLENLLDPRSRTRAQAAGFVTFPPPSGDEIQNSGMRAYIDEHVLLETELGNIEIALRPDVAPNTAFNFLHLVKGGFYTDTVVHRIVGRQTPDGHPFVFQFGDPLGTGRGGPGYKVDLEPSPLPHDFGVVSMARASEPDSAGSQVFVCLSREGTKLLDGQYASFGQIVGDAQALVRVESVPMVENSDRPRNPPHISTAKAIPAPPYGEGPLPATRPAPAGSDR